MTGKSPLYAIAQDAPAGYGFASVEIICPESVLKYVYFLAKLEEKSLYIFAKLRILLTDESGLTPSEFIEFANPNILLASSTIAIFLSLYGVNLGSKSLLFELIQLKSSDQFLDFESCSISVPLYAKANAVSYTQVRAQET